MQFSETKQDVEPISLTKNAVSVIKRPLTILTESMNRLTVTLEANINECKTSKKVQEDMQEAQSIKKVIQPAPSIVQSKDGECPRKVTYIIY